MVETAKELDKVDADGKLGFKDNAALIFAIETARRDKLDEAISLFEGLLAKWPESDKADVAMAWLGLLYYQAKKDIPKAEKTITTMIQKFPKSAMLEQAKDLLETLQQEKKKGK